MCKVNPSKFHSSTGNLNCIWYPGYCLYCVWKWSHSINTVSISHDLRRYYLTFCCYKCNSFIIWNISVIRHHLYYNEWGRQDLHRTKCKKTFTTWECPNQSPSISISSQHGRKTCEAAQQSKALLTKGPARINHKTRWIIPMRLVTFPFIR